MYLKFKTGTSLLGDPFSRLIELPWLHLYPYMKLTYSNLAGASVPRPRLPVVHLIIT